MFLFAQCCDDKAVVQDSPGDVVVDGGKKGPSVGTSAGDSSRDPGRPVQEAKDVVSEPRDLVLTVHNATLNRSFAKIGWMDPYAIIRADSAEVGRTKPAKHAHKSPKWDMDHNFQQGHIPNTIMIAVWDKNNFHRDVFCGAVAIPCSADMGSLLEKDFTLTKNSKATGTVRVSLKAVCKTTGEVPAADRSVKRKKTLGGELDAMVAWAEGEGDANAQVMLEEHADHPVAPNDDANQDEGAAMTCIQTTGGGKAAPLMGSWKCIDTFGLDEFLKASGVGSFQRSIAARMKWPAWDFSNEGGHVLFVNHSAVGDLKEEIIFDKQYDWKDGQKNDFTCLAEWIKTEDGGILKIDRKGKVGDYVEERAVKGDRLEFTLTHSNGVKWGRTFERA